MNKHEPSVNFKSDRNECQAATNCNLKILLNRGK